MVDFEGLKDKAVDFAEGHADQVDKAIDKAADVIGDKVGHESEIDKAADKLKNVIPGD